MGAMKKMQKKEKAMEKQLSRLRQLEEIEVPGRNEVVRSAMAILKKAMAILKKEQKQTSKQMTGRLVRHLMAQFEKELSHAKAEREHRVEQQDSKLRELMVAIDRIGSHVNSSVALKKLQKEVKALEKKELKAKEKRLSHLRPANKIEALRRNKWVRSAIADLKQEEKQTSKQMINLAMRKEEKIITSKEFTAAKKLHTTLKKLSGRLMRQLMAQFESELSNAKEREHRVEQQD